MGAAEPVLHAAGVYVSLGGMPVLRDVGVDVAKGSLVALLGGNGSGKTTFIRALLGLNDHTSGVIEWFGTPLAQFRDWSRVGYVPQRGPMQSSNATVSEVVASGLLPRRLPFQPLGKAGRAAIMHSLERVNLTDRAAWPMTKLSGGQAQRALIARALVGTPEVLVLDEPMAGIDLQTQDRLAELFAELKASGLAMLVVLHEQGAMGTLVDEAVALHDGRVVADLPALHDHDHTSPARDAVLGLADPLEVR